MYHELSEMVFNQEPINQQILILFYVESYYTRVKLVAVGVEFKNTDIKSCLERN